MEENREELELMNLEPEEDTYVDEGSDVNVGLVLAGGALIGVAATKLIEFGAGKVKGAIAKHKAKKTAKQNEVEVEFVEDPDEEEESDVEPEEKTEKKKNG
jgi:hypothetical protein